MDVYAIGMDLLKGIGFFFLHPLFFILLLFSFFLGYRRVQRERRDFHTRVYDIVDDLFVPLLPGLITGLLVSIVTIAIGIVIPIGVIALFTVVYVTLILTGQARFLSPAYSGGLTMLIALIFPKFETGIVIIDRWIAEIHSVHLGGLALLMSALLVMEGILIIKNGSEKTSPQFLKSKRGKIIGAHKAERMWMLPIFLLLPAGPIFSTEIWPFINYDSSQFGIIVVPFAIGFQQVIRSTLPVYAIINNGKRVLFVGITVLVLSALSLYFPIITPVIAIVAIVGRETVATLLKLNEEKETNMYTKRENGLVILGVIPHSPAAKMAVKVGEIVTKVNGVRVTTSQQVYEALQLNSAFCKLEIIDENAEIRFAQTALYDGEHHQVGLLFVRDESQYEEKAI